MSSQHDYSCEIPSGPSLMPAFAAGFILGIGANILALISGKSILIGIFYHSVFGMLGMVGTALLLIALHNLRRQRIQHRALKTVTS